MKIETIMKKSNNDLTSYSVVLTCTSTLDIISSTTVFVEATKEESRVV